MSEFVPTAHRLAALDAITASAAAVAFISDSFVTQQWLAQGPLPLNHTLLLTGNGITMIPLTEREGAAQTIRQVLKEQGLQHNCVIAVETSTIRPHLAAALQGHPLVDVTTDLSAQRMVKSSTELQSLRTAAQRASRGQQVFRENLSIGITELDLSTAIQMELGRDGSAPAAIVDLMFGPRCLLMGVAPTAKNTLKPGQTALFDYAPMVDDYWGDSCTTIVAADPSREQIKAFDAAERALYAGIAELRPGALASDVDRTVRAAMADKGFTYPHLTGHGIGLQQQERPFITAESTDVLAAGMVIALEPGTYYPEIGGIRLEHVVEVTDTGPRILTDHAFSIAP